MPDLKRCPFCNGIPKAEVRIASMGPDRNELDFSVVCGGCGVNKTVRLKFVYTADLLDVEKAIDEVMLAWNSRAAT